MIVLISPTKTQKALNSEDSAQDLLFPAKKDKLVKKLQKLSSEQLQREMKISDKLSIQTHQNYQNFHEVYTAIDTYYGLSFKYLNSPAWSSAMRSYAQDHLLIFSALYGLVRPLDRVALYRLDLIHDCGLQLYDYWNSSLTDYLNRQNKMLLDLSSKEYSKLISWENLNSPYLRIDFLEADGKNRSSYAKILRGKFAHHILKEKIQNFSELKKIVIDDYIYQEDLSSSNHYVFMKQV